jgi:hypothetical protein
MSYRRSKGVSRRTLGRMSQIGRIRVTWSGTPVVGPGVSTFYLTDTITAGWPAALVSLFTALKNYVPTGVTWTVPSQTDLIETTTGQLTGVTSPGGGGSVLSSGGAVDYKPGVGGRMRWTTGGIVGGRKVTGTTFLVPMTSQECPNGVIQAGTVTAINTAMAAYIANAAFEAGVYSRPRPAGTRNGVPYAARAGAVFPIAGNNVPTGITWLRSRRT